MKIEHSPCPWVWLKDDRQSWSGELYARGMDSVIRLEDTYQGYSERCRELRMVVETGDSELIGRACEVPHSCSVPDCPGNRNRRKLELWDEMLAALEDAVECGMIPKSSAADGGANKYSSQVKAADKIRSAIAKAKELK